MAETKIDQAIMAHRAGKLQEAEALYRDILLDQPKHTDANHNLGVLALSVKKLSDALPLLKTALDGNPNKVQYWISYIDALIRNNLHEAARSVLDQGKKIGLSGAQVDALSQQLASENKESDLEENMSQPLEQQDKKFSEKKDNKKVSPTLRGAVHSGAPSQVEISALLEHYQSGQHARTESLAIAMSKKFPNHQFAWHVLGAVSRSTGHLQKAEQAYQKAVALAKNDATAHSNLGVILQELGRLEESAESLSQAVALKPDFAEAHNNLGNTFKELGRLRDAEESFRHAIALKPESDEARFNLALFLYECKEFEKAADQFKLLNTKSSKSFLLRCLYSYDDRSLFNELLDNSINLGESNSIIGSLCLRSNMKYRTKIINPFCGDPFKYIKKIDLTQHYNFNVDFIAATREILERELLSEKNQSHLTNGYQTAGNLFSIESDATKVIRRIIFCEIDKYRSNFKNSDQGLIRLWPNNYDLNGWLICMRSGGKLAPHMHEMGWVSGSIYINVPPKIQENSGNLVLCIDDRENYEDGVKNQSQVIDVFTGCMVLFPSSLMHYTIPFKSDENRVVLAFDIVPK